MSIRRIDPLDAHFREMLHDTEVTPPPAVWQHVHERLPKAADRPWPIVGLLCMCLSAAGIFVLSQTLSQGVHMADQAQTNDPRTRTHGGPGPAHAEGATSAMSRTTAAPLTPATLSDQDAGRAEKAPPHTTRDDQPLPSASIGVDGGAGSQSRGRAALANEPLPHEVKEQHTPLYRGDMSGSGHIQGTTERAMDDLHAYWQPLREVTLERNELAPSLVSMPMIMPMLRGEWWMGAQVGSFARRTRWLGKDASVLQLLNSASGVGGSVFSGVVVERKWPGNWGFHTGVAAEFTEQQYSITGHRTRVEQDLVTYLVTLDDLVFVNYTDTVEHIVQEEHTVAGTARRASLLVPLAITWQRPVRRFTIGVLFGSLLDMPVGGRTMVQPDAWMGEQGIQPETASTMLNARQPMSISLLTALDLGYVLHERWTVAGSAQYAPGVYSITQGRNVHSINDRLGIDLRLMYHIQ